MTIPEPEQLHINIFINKVASPLTWVSDFHYLRRGVVVLKVKWRELLLCKTYRGQDFTLREWRKYLTSSWNVDWTLLSSSTLTIPRFLIPVAPCCVNSWVFTGAQFYEEKSKNKTVRWFPAEMWHVSERIWELYHAIWIRTDIRDIRSSSFVIWNHKIFKLQCSAVKH